MAILGQAYPLSYYAKNGKTGLTNVTAKAKLPDGSFEGPFILSEETEPGFEGFYTVNYSTASNGLEGQYLFVIYEPSSGHKNFHRAMFENISSSGGGAVDLKRNGFTEIVVNKDQNTILETSSANTKINIIKTKNVIIQVSDDDTNINTDGNNTEIGV